MKYPLSSSSRLFILLLGAGAGGSLELLSDRRRWLHSLLLGQSVAFAGLLIYALLSPIVPHDGVGVLLTGLLIGVVIELYRRSQ